jgi:hypothetical protein
LPLEDWLVPVHYLRRDVSFPEAVTPRTGSLSLDEELDRIRSTRFSGASDRAEIDPVGKFIGRDWLTCQLEVAARLQRVVVLHGPAGTGKTELAKGFGRWWRDTGGVDDPQYVTLLMLLLADRGLRAGSTVRRESRRGHTARARNHAREHVRWRVAVPLWLLAMWRWFYPQEELAEALAAAGSWSDEVLPERHHAVRLDNRMPV